MTTAGEAQLASTQSPFVFHREEAGGPYDGGLACTFGSWTRRRRRCSTAGLLWGTMHGRFALNQRLVQALNLLQQHGLDIHITKAPKRHDRPGAEK